MSQATTSVVGVVVIAGLLAICGALVLIDYFCCQCTAPANCWLQLLVTQCCQVVGSTGAMGIGEWTPVFYQKLVMCLSFNERSLFTLGIMVLVMAACIAAKLKDVMSGRISQTERSVTLQSRDPLCGERPH